MTGCFDTNGNILGFSTNAVGETFVEEWMSINVRVRFISGPCVTRAYSKNVYVERYYLQISTEFLCLATIVNIYVLNTLPN